ncbi:MAG: LLM class flavin-dependent oxidoreductase [Nostocoides sp.]
MTPSIAAAATDRACTSSPHARTLGKHRGLPQLLDRPSKPALLGNPRPLVSGAGLQPPRLLSGHSIPSSVDSAAARRWRGGWRGLVPIGLAAEPLGWLRAGSRVLSPHERDGTGPHKSLRRVYPPDGWFATAWPLTDARRPGSMCTTACNCMHKECYVVVESWLMSRVGIYGFAWGANETDVDHLMTLAHAADDVGIHSLHMPWHFTLNPSSYGWENDSILEPLAILPYLAAGTTQLKFGLTPFSPGVMHPYFWARYLATLSRISSGRAIGLVRPSHVADDYRIGLSPNDPDGARFANGLASVTHLLSGDRPLEGTERIGGGFWDIQGLSLGFAAPPVSMWIGGQSSADLTLAANYGDVLRPGVATGEQARAVKARLDQECERTGRHVRLATTVICAVLSEGDSADWVTANVERPLAIRQARLKALGGSGEAIVGTAQQCAEKLQDLLDAGVDYLLLDTQFHGWQSVSYSIEQIRRLHRDVAPLVRVPEGPPSQVAPLNVVKG